MADSVGKIQLDIEISPSSIAREMSSLNRTFNSGIKNTFNRMNSFVKNSMARMAGSIRSMVPGEAKEMPAELAEQIESLTAQMDNATSMAEMYRQRLKELARDYAMLDAASKKGVFGEQLREDMLKTEGRMLRYGARSDKLRREIEKLEAAAAQAGQTTEKAGRQIDAAGKQVSKAKKGFGGFATTIQRAFTRVLRQVFIFTVLYKVIRGLIDYIGSALKTNEAFSNSLAQVKTNLQVAFMPIYQAVLPALQTLMRWLATATTYIAAFTSAIFGKTYKASFAAAKGINAAKAGMEGYGKAAKKTLGALAGFDELHVLGGPETDAGTGAGAGAAGPDLVAPPVDTTAFEAGVLGMRERVISFFQSLKAWWQKEGAAMFAPHREALQTLWEKTLIPIKDFVLYDYYAPIIRAALDSLVPIFADVIPWAIAETGKRWLWLAGVANMIWTDIIEPVYTLIRNIVVDTLGIISELWEEHGQGLLDGLSEFFQNVRDLWDKLWTEILEPIIIPFWEMLQGLWDDHLKDLVKQVGDFVMKLIKGALDLYNGFIAPIVKWLIDFMAPKVKFAFEFVRDVIKTVVGTISDILKGVIKILGGIIDFIVGIFTGDWKRAWDGIKNIVTGIWDIIVGAIKGAINLIINGINALIRGMNKIKFDVPSWVPLLGGKKFGFNIPQIPTLARGGIIDQPTLAMIGERGKKEAVLPLEQNTGWMDTLAAKIAAVISGQSGGEEGPWIIQVNVGSSKVLEEIIDAARRKNAKAGRTVVQVGV